MDKNKSLPFSLDSSDMQVEECCLRCYKVYSGKSTLTFERITTLLVICLAYSSAVKAKAVQPSVMSSVKFCLPDYMATHPQKTAVNIVTTDRNTNPAFSKICGVQ